jgi:uncharacterized protein (TIGR02600 family)
LIVLGCVALLTILVTAFLITARTEFTTSNFYAKGVNTKLLSENVINLVMAQLREGARSSDLSTGAQVAWASQPGMIRTYDTQGANSPTYAYKYFKLYSWDNMVGSGAFDETAAGESPPAGWSSLPNIYTDLNEPVNGSYPIIDPRVANPDGSEKSVEGFSFTTPPGASAANPLPMPVKWLYVLKDGTVTVATPKGAGTAVTVTGANTTNPVIGRIAFWTDDETCKVNINTASEGLFWSVPFGQSSEELGTWTAAFTYVSPYGYNTSLPASQEFQRVPGHPAQTCLSTVFGFGPNAILPVTGLEGPLQWPLTAGAGGTYSTTFGPYFSLTPRLQAGGSMGGAQPAPLPFTPPDYRLYDSVDELAFDPDRTAMTTAGSVSLYPAANGAEPSGRAAAGITQQVIDERRFFLTAHSRAPEETLFGTPRISLWPLQAQTEARTAKDNLLAFCSTISGEPYYFQRATYYEYQQNTSSTIKTTPGTPSSQSPTADFPNVPTSNLQKPVSATLGNVERNENLYAYLQALTSAGIPGFGGNFLAKYPGGPSAAGPTVTDRDQILTEMFDLLRSGVNTFDIAYPIFPLYSFSPFGLSAPNGYSANGGAGTFDPGAGTTIPISIPNNTHGLGRNYTIAEVSLVFTASQMDLANVAAGTPDPAAPNPLHRISIGQNMPWANEIETAGLFTVPPYQTSPPAPTIPKPCWLYWDTYTGNYGAYVYEPTNTDTGAPALVAVDPTTNQPQVNSGHQYVHLATQDPTGKGTIVTIGDPQTTAVQAYLIIRPYGVVPGPPTFRPNIRIRITNLDRLRVNGNNLGFPSASNAVAILNTQTNVSSAPSGGLTEAFGNLSNNPNQGPPPWVNTGSNPTTNYNYPFEGKSTSLNNTSYPSPYGGEDEPRHLSTNNPPPPMIPIHVLANGSGNYAGSTMLVGGTTLQIDVLDGVSTMAQASLHPLETVFVKIPNMTLPVPTVERANGSAFLTMSNVEPFALSGATRIPGYGGTPSGAPPSLNYYWQTTQDFLGILTGVQTGTYGTGIAARWATFAVDGLSAELSSINRGDVVRSFVVNPSSQVAGDMRMLAANPIRVMNTNASGNLATDDFVPLGSQRTDAFYQRYPTQGPAFPELASFSTGSQSLFIRQLHSLLTDRGRPFSICLVQTSLPILSAPGGILDAPGYNQGGGMGETSGALIQDPTLPAPSSAAPAISTEDYAVESAPLVTPELQGAFMDPTTRTIPGDWSLDFGTEGDGGFVVKPDEGSQDPVVAGTTNVEYGFGSVYYSTSGNNGFETTDLSYTPSRQVASPVIFGTLPSRVFGGLTANSSGGVPWCTLLFCPNPAAGAAHPGFGKGSGTPGPTDYPPYAIPPDHLFLDLFWMPVVEPYAISEPFSTAGKVNMNYEIVPFTYIHRSTALHAVMKPTRLTAIATTFNDAGTSNTGISLNSPPPEQNNFPSVKAVASSNYTNPNGSQFNYSIRYGINLNATIDDPDSAFQTRFGQHDLFRSASEICNVFLVPEEVQLAPGSFYVPASVAPAPPTDALPADMETWWSNYGLTGDNGREDPYNQIYPRLTTKSNTFEVHMRVQVLSQTTADRATGTFDTSAGDSIVGEYRGSAIVERYLDPNQTALPDFATVFPNDSTVTVDNFIHYRVVSTHAFSP